MFTEVVHSGVAPVVLVDSQIELDKLQVTQEDLQATTHARQSLFELCGTNCLREARTTGARMVQDAHDGEDGEIGIGTQAHTTQRRQRQPMKGNCLPGRRRERMVDTESSESACRTVGDNTQALGSDHRTQEHVGQ